MQRIIFNVLLIVSPVLFAGCQQKTVMPDEVAHDYWNAVQSGNTSSLKNLTIDPDEVNEGKLISSLDLKNFKIKRTIIEADSAIVEVDLELTNTGSVPVPIDTILVKQDHSWLVDHRTTLASLRKNSEIGDAIAELHKFSRMFSRDLDQSLDQLERQAPAIRKNIVDLMQKMTARVPILKRELENLVKDIDKTIKPLMEQQNQPSQQPGKVVPATPQSNSNHI
ncbi:MAG: hypothetical protein V3V18_11380 [Methylococcales bacterium]